jgi:uncharacterized PurR-regulated membrane protein YhhQ (DUF165 family)
MNTNTAAAIYVFALVSANLSVAHFGPWVSPISALLFIGLDLYLRDHLHEKWIKGGNSVTLYLKMSLLISLAGGVSYVLNPASGKIAIASLLAFCFAMTVDTLVYQRLLSKPKLVKQNASNSAAAAVDSLVFPAIAFGGFLPEIVALQFSAKLLGGFVWSKFLEKRDAS